MRPCRWILADENAWGAHTVTVRRCYVLHRCNRSCAVVYLASALKWTQWRPQFDRTPMKLRRRRRARNLQLLFFSFFFGGQAKFRLEEVRQIDNIADRRDNHLLLCVSVVSVATRCGPEYRIARIRQHPTRIAGASGPDPIKTPQRLQIIPQPIYFPSSHHAGESWVTKFAVSLVNKFKSLPV